eukprot:TRINITY_DN72511_c0_g1_i1.p1 TRINITY_DN72511_c0_g1~~TRINITY_DN72511_c0_g1_i1.p1  ORF type:complete len:669 (+),score=115.67 TRINITY_DN72511_c0_g1_i1:53-2008(+)
MGCISSSAGAADLCTAVERSMIDNIRKIIEAGVREDDPDKFGRTALHVATGSSQWDKVGWPALQGLRVNAAAELLQGLERKTPGADGLEALKLFNGQSSKRYRSHGGTPEINASVLYRGATPLVLAVGLGRWQVAQWILENHGRSAGLDECEVGWAALHFACCGSGNEEVAKQLITLEADVNLEDSCGEVPLFLAAHSDAWGIVNLLLRSGARPKMNSNDIFFLAEAAGVELESVRSSAEEGRYLLAARFLSHELENKVDEGHSLAFMHSFAKLPSPRDWASTLLAGPEFSNFKKETGRIFEVDNVEESILLACQQQGVTLFLAQQVSREESYKHTSGLEFSVGSWRVRVGLCYAHQVRCRDRSEYRDALSWYKQAMLMPSNWDAEQIIINGEWCSSDSEGREFPANFLMRELDNVKPFQDLFDACMRTVYTRDRHGDKVPDALKVHKVLRCQNDQVFAQYHRTHLELQKKCRGADLGFNAEELVTMRHLQQQATQIEAFASLDVQAVNECWLFHGTSPVAADLIARNDFRLSKAGSNAGTLYGRGLYFAQNPSKSDEYSSAEEDGLFTMIIARVLLGKVLYTDEVRPDVSKIESSCRPLPTMGGVTMRPNTYQSVVGDREKSRGTFKEIVVFDDDQVYPEFIVKYRRVFN